MQTVHDCVFCKILRQEITAEIVASNDTVFVIRDIAPKAPLHFLIIPKKHIADISALTAQDQKIAADLLLMAQNLSSVIPGAQEFRLVSNNGASIGQSVFHIHLHFLAGKKLSF